MITPIADQFLPSPEMVKYLQSICNHFNGNGWAIETKCDCIKISTRVQNLLNVNILIYEDRVQLIIAKTEMSLGPNVTAFTHDFTYEEFKVYSHILDKGTACINEDIAEFCNSIRIDDMEILRELNRRYHFSKNEWIISFSNNHGYKLECTTKKFAIFIDDGNIRIHFDLYDDITFNSPRYDIIADIIRRQFDD